MVPLKLDFTAAEQPESSMPKLTANVRAAMTDRSFAFPTQRKEPLANESHVRNAIARFGQVAGVTDAERDSAWQRIRAAAKKFGVDVHEHDWRQLTGASPKKAG
jgi:hypothetical protein